MLPAVAGRRLESYPEFTRYARLLALWLGLDLQDSDELEAAGAALCRLARTLPVSLDELLAAVRSAHASPEVPRGSDAVARVSQRRAHRYAIALNQVRSIYYW